jgi:hypothetical protein
MTSCAMAGEWRAAQFGYPINSPLLGCGPADPPGSTFTITVTEYTPDRTPVNGPSASASFTVTAP